MIAVYRKYVLALCCFLMAGKSLSGQIPETIVATAKVMTSPVIHNANDPAIWIHPTERQNSLILGTDTGTYPNGGLYIWNLDGSLQERLNISHPLSVDVRYAVQLGTERVDIVAVTMPDHDEIRVYKVDPLSRTLESITTEGGINTANVPFGLALYQRPVDEALFAFVSYNHVDDEDEVAEFSLEQFLLEDDGNGMLKGTVVRRFGDNDSVVASMAVDDQLGYLYVSENAVGVHKYHCDREFGEQRLALFAENDGISGERGGITLFQCAGRSGYILVTSPQDNAIKVYARGGEPDDPHRHALITTILNSSAQPGIGIAATNVGIASSFANGMLVWHDQKENLFQLHPWEDVSQNFLDICPADNFPTSVEIGSIDRSPKDFELNQNYPNPFNPTTEIQFELSGYTPVSLRVYNVNGREVKTLLSQNLAAGSHVAQWNGRDNLDNPAASGVYLYQIQTDKSSETRRMVLLR